MASAAEVVVAAKKLSRPYIYEIDLVRATTAFTVVTIHSLSTTAFLVSSTAGIQILDVIIHSLHYNREVFMFITGLVLTYVYYDGNRFKRTTFWLNRLRLIFIPYVLWTLIYVLYFNRHISIGRDLYLWLWNTLTGNAAPQLYYISLTLQFCALFPLFLRFMRRLERYPWRTLGISFVLQCLLVFLDFRSLQNGRWSSNHAVSVIVLFQNRFLPLYQFFFILGGFTAIYITPVKAWLARYGRLVPLLAIGSLAGFVAYYFYQINHLHQSIATATDVLQPSVVLYSCVAIVTIGWLATIWAKRCRWHGMIKSISDTSFGIYFVHILILQILVRKLIPALPAGFPALLIIIGTAALTFILSASLCYLIFKIPLLSWTIGKAQRLKFNLFRKPASPVKL